MFPLLPRARGNFFLQVSISRSGIDFVAEITYKIWYHFASQTGGETINGVFCIALQKMYKRQEVSSKTCMLIVLLSLYYFLCVLFSSLGRLCNTPGTRVGPDSAGVFSAFHGQCLAAHEKRTRVILTSFFFNLRTVQR